MKLKVCVAAPSYFPYMVGMTYASHIHANLLSELGADVTLLMSQKDFSFTKTDEIINYEVKYVNLQGSGLPWNRVSGDIDSFVKVIADIKPDIYIAEGWYTWCSELIPLITNLCPSIHVASHGSADLSFNFLNIADSLRYISYVVKNRFLMPNIYKALSSVIFLSDYSDNKRFKDVSILRKFGIPTRICPNFSIYENSNYINSNRMAKRLLHIGEMKEHKNQLSAVDLLSKLPDDYSLELAFPEITDYYHLVRESAIRKSVIDRIVFTIGKSRIALLDSYKRASCLLILTPSKDVQPIVAVDGLCVGLPFVSTRVGCMPSFRGGIVSDVDTMHNSVLQIHSNDSVYYSFSNDALSYYSTNLCKDAARNSLNAILNESNKSR